jgi:O-antigen ligase
MSYHLKTLQNRADILAKWLLVCVFATFPVAMGLANVLMAATLLMWVLSGNYLQRWHAVRNSAVTWSLISLYVIILIGSLYSIADAQEIRLHIVKYSKLCICIVFMSLLAEAKWREYCFNAYIVAMTFIVVSVYANVYIDLPWSKTHNQGWGVNHTVVGDYITQNIMISFFVLLSGLYAIDAEKKNRRYAWAAISLASALSVAQLSQGRTGFLLLIIAVACIAVRLVMCTKKTSLRLFAAFSSIALVVVAILTSPILSQRFEQALSEGKNFQSQRTTSIGIRIYNTTKSLELIEQKPILGHGTGSYHKARCSVAEIGEKCEIYNWHPDNQYLLFAVCQGLIGLGIFIWLIAATLKLAHNQPSGLRLLILGYALMLAINSAINSSLFSSRENHFFMYILALLAASALANQRLTKSK